MNEPTHEGHDLSPSWGAAAIITGFLLGIPIALVFGPIILPLLPDWLNDLGKNVACSLLVGLFAGAGTALILMFSDHCPKRH